MHRLKFSLTVAFLMLAIFSISACQSSGEFPLQNIREGELPKDVSISLRRSVCYGTCPDYTVTVSGDGSVVYEGRKFVKTTGTVNSSISQEKVRQLLEEFKKANYFSLRDKYQDESDGCPEVSTDNPSAKTSLTVNGKSKSIFHYYGCKENNAAYPRDLTELERKIDAIIGTQQWIK